MAEQVIGGQPQQTMMASVMMDGTGRLTATVNPNLDEKQKLVLACQCAEMFARIAGQQAMTQEGRDKPKILVPTMTGIKL